MSTVLITGSNGGIGSEICKTFKKKGWSVIGIDIHETSSNPDTTSYYQVNLFNSDEIKLLMNKLDSLDCLIHCAAYQCCKPIWEYTNEEWDNTYACNVKAVFLMIKYGIDTMKKSKTNIINIASIHAFATSKHIASYASSKAALVGFTKNAAIDLAPFGIRVNSISPGAIDTQMLRSHLSDQRLQYLKDKHLLKNIGSPMHIANTCLFINNNTFMNGNNIIMDGGILAQLSSE